MLSNILKELLLCFSIIIIAICGIYLLLRKKAKNITKDNKMQYCKDCGALLDGSKSEWIVAYQKELEQIEKQGELLCFKNIALLLKEVLSKILIKKFSLSFINIISMLNQNGGGESQDSKEVLEYIGYINDFLNTLSPLKAKNLLYLSLALKDKEINLDDYYKNVKSLSTDEIITNDTKQILELLNISKIDLVTLRRQINEQIDRLQISKSPIEVSTDQRNTTIITFLKTINKLITNILNLEILEKEMR